VSRGGVCHKTSLLTRRTLSLVASLVLLLGCCHRVTAGESGRFGIRGLDRTKGLPQAVQIAKRAGVTWTRIAVFWDEVEPKEGHFEWKEIDTIVSEVLGQGIHVLVTVRGYSSWASERAKIVAHERKKWLKHKQSAPPGGQYVEHYKRFVRYLVERYDGDDDTGPFPVSEETRSVLRRQPIKYWQIENEPGSCDVNKGSNFWNGTARCLKGYPEHMLQVFRKNRFSFDIFDIHNYRNIATVYRQVGNVKKLLNQHGYNNVRIWMTETDFNWRKLKAGISQEAFSENRTMEMIKRHVAAFGEGVEKVFQWTLTDSKEAKWPPREQTELSKFRGIADRDLNPKPIFFSYQLMISKLDGFSKAEKITSSPSNLFRFVVTNRPVFVAWSDTGASNVSLGIGQVKVSDVFGRVRVEDSNKLIVTQVPVFIETTDVKSPK
jgi:hypothetical protein